jgi:hypothetical protein
LNEERGNLSSSGHKPRTNKQTQNPSSRLLAIAIKKPKTKKTKKIILAILLWCNIFFFTFGHVVIVGVAFYFSF